MKLLTLISFLILSSCMSDADKASWSAFGYEGNIKCYSSDKVILDTNASGRIQATSQHGGWEFKEKSTGDFIRVSGPCVIRNPTK